jgi:copper chaperone CopZ
MAAHTFTVARIACGACEGVIREALGAVAGVRLVDADAASDRVTVIFDDRRLDAPELAGLLAAAGFPVRHELTGLHRKTTDPGAGRDAQ